MADKAWVYISLSSGHKVKIDRQDQKRVGERSWRVSEGTTGRLRVVTSIREGDKVTNVTLGKFLMKPGKGKQVYPRRFNEGLDYRKSNLIVCTLKERQRLLPKNRAKATSSFRGVSFVKADKKWRAAIEVNGKSLNLGHFKSEDQAAGAYNHASKKYFGSMGYQNPVGRAKKARKD